MPTNLCVGYNDYAFGLDTFPFQNDTQKVKDYPNLRSQELGKEQTIEKSDTLHWDLQIPCDHKNQDRLSSLQNRQQFNPYRHHVAKSLGLV